MQSHPKSSALLVCTLASLVPLHAAETRIHVTDSSAQLLAGKTSGVAILQPGRAELGPELELATDVGEPIVWSMASDGDGRLFLGTGHDGKLFSLEKDATEATLLFDAEELEVTALAHDGKKTLYAATSPNGKVYRITEKGDATVLWDPPDRFVWALATTPEGLLVGTGSQARIWRVDGSGEAKAIYTSAEKNVTSLAVLGTTIFAGTDDSGKLFHVGSDGHGFAIYDSPLREISSLAPGPDGTLYAVAVEIGPKPDAGAAAGGPAGDPAPTPGGRGKSEVVRLDLSGARSGTAEVLQRSSDDPLLRICPGADGTMLLGSASVPGGRLYALGEGGMRVLAALEEGQATSIVSLGNGGAALATSSPGRVYRLAARPASRGTVTGAVVDAGGIARFGRLTWLGGEPAGSRLEVRARVGNTPEPGPDWTPWSDRLTDGASMTGPRARYLQWKVELVAGPESRTPWIERIEVASLQENVPPIVEGIDVLGSGIVPKNPSRSSDPSSAAMPDDEDLFARNIPEVSDTPAPPPPRRYEWRHGMRTATWQAKDPNGDRVVYDLSYRREAAEEGSYVALKTGLLDDWYAFDTTSLPDGLYRLRVQASDRQDNDPTRAQVASRESALFEIDNTPPRVAASRAEGERVRLTASDSSALVRAYVSIAPGPWVPILPEDGITDGESESWNVDPATILAPGNARGLMLFKVFDAAGNVGSESVELRVAK